MFKLFTVPKARERSRESLPRAPDGMAWVQNPQTRDWSLVPQEEVPTEVTVDFEAVDSQSQSQSHSSAFDNPFGVGQEQDQQEDPNSNPILRHVLLTHVPTSSREESKATEDQEQEDWELLSDKHSGSNSNSISNGIAFVSRTGSVSTKNSSLLHKRTPSSSTIDSCDLMNLGPSGKGVLGVDYVEHVIMPTDTLQGICLAYKVTPSRLKRANHFSGDSLLLAPKKLVIPISKQALRQGYLRVQDTDTKEYKMHAIQLECPMLGLTEAKAYLELADWNLKDAIQSAREDFEWEKELPNGELRPGQIRVMMNVQSHPETGHLLHFSAQGAGYNHNHNKHKQQTEEEKTNEVTTLKPVHPNTVNAKSVQPQDIHSVAPTHNSFGLEMLSLSTSSKESLATTKN